MFGAHVERYGVPEAMLMDHGTVWWSTTNGYGLTWLSVRLIEQGIRLHYARGSSADTGKSGAIHRTLDEAIRHRGKPKQLAGGRALEEFVRCTTSGDPMKRWGCAASERYRASVQDTRAAGVGISQRELLRS